MCVRQGVCHFATDLDRSGNRKLAFSVEASAQRLAVDKRHYVEQLTVGLAAVEEREDVRVLQPRCSLDLRESPPR